MSLDHMSKQQADGYLEQGDDEIEVPAVPSCEGCEAVDVPLRDYYDGRMKKPLMLCEDCETTKAEQAYERSCADFYGGSGDATTARHIREARR